MEKISKRRHIIFYTIYLRYILYCRGLQKCHKDDLSQNNTDKHTKRINRGIAD